MFKIVRVAILLMLLASVWTTVNLQRNVTRDWQGTIDIAIVPVIADQDPRTRTFVEDLEARDFSEINNYLVTQAKRFERDLDYGLNIVLADAIEVLPPLPPPRTQGRIAVMLWSLKLRWWAWRNEAEDHHSMQTRLYVLYQTPAQNQQLPHSTGLQNGLIGLIHARSKPESRRHNNVVLVHELLHILGAKDKYDLANGRPIYPQGFVNAERKYPQRHAEIMARSIPLTETKFEVAERLNQTRIGKVTAIEIGW